MSADLSPESEQFIQQAVAAGLFPDRGRALDEAVGLLKRRQELMAHIEEGTQQLRSGDFVEYNQEGLRRFFDDVQARGRARYAAGNEHS
jgi:Arc/MetJ-type ribon-helix-helix transcriptional regulator